MLKSLSVLSRPALALLAAVLALTLWASGGPTVLADHTCQGLSSTIHGTDGPDVIFGTEGDDVIQGLGEYDLIYGLGGNDVLCGEQLNGGPGDDTLDGGFADYFNAPGPVTASLVDGTATGHGNDKLIGIRRLSGSAFGDTLTGDSLGNLMSGGGGPDVLVGGAGNDGLQGGEGNDELHGGDGADRLEQSFQPEPDTGGDDVLDGGPGTDTLDYSFLTDPVTVHLAAGRATGQGIDRLSSIEVVIGSGGNDTLVGDSGPNTFDGSSGDDMINGAGGNDTASFGAVFDSGVIADLTAGTATGHGTDTLVAIENLTGSAPNDTLIGDGGPNILMGGIFFGNDNLQGAGGDDTLIGGFNTDSLDGGADTDTCDPEPGADTLLECEIVPTPPARFDHSITSCGGTCIELLMTIVNVSGPAVGVALTGGHGTGTIELSSSLLAAGWEGIGGKGGGGVCIGQGVGTVGASSPAFTVQPGSSLPLLTNEWETDPACPSHSMVVEWALSTLDGVFIEDGGFTIPDTDSDGYFDVTDNCPAIANSAQADFNGNGIGDACEDSDGDGALDGLELHVGTGPLLFCSADTTADNEDTDARPTDFNDDRAVTGADLSAVAGVIGLLVPPAAVRRDIAPDPAGDGAVTGADLSRVAAVIGTAC